jgi:hypothetical protein
MNTTTKHISLKLTTSAVLIFILAVLIQPAFAQWTLCTPMPAVMDYPGLSVYSPDGIIAIGGDANTARIFKSTNGGLNWNDITGNLANTPRIISVWAVDGNTIFAGDGGSFSSQGGNAKVWKTTNGGINWVNILSTGGTAGYINGIVFLRASPSFGIIASDSPAGPGQPFWMQKTTDGGNNWQPVTVPGYTGSFGGDHTVFVIDSLFFGFGISNSGSYAALTTDGGLTWNNRFLNNAGGYTTGLAFNSDKLNGIGVGNGVLPVISKTDNGGINWSSLNTGRNVSGNFSRAKWVYGTNICFVTAETGASGTIMVSSNNGTNWNTQSTAGVTGLNDIDLIYESGVIYAYAISTTGSVIKLQQTTGIKTIGGTSPDNFKLMQNYPNPFNPSTNIRFQLPGQSMVSLKVYDISGKEISTLVNENLPAGNYEVAFKGSNLSSGTYFYKLSAGNYSETKRMMLLK